METHGRKVVPLYKEHDMEEHRIDRLDQQHDDAVLERRLHASDHVLAKCGLTREQVLKLTRLNR